MCHRLPTRYRKGETENDSDIAGRVGRLTTQLAE